MPQEYRSVKDKTIHHPHASWASDEQHSMFGLPDWSLLGGFSSSSNIMLKREGETDESGVSHHGNQLLVCIHNKVGPYLLISRLGPHAASNTAAFV